MNRIDTNTLAGLNAIAAKHSLTFNTYARTSNLASHAAGSKSCAAWYYGTTAQCRRFAASLGWSLNTKRFSDGSSEATAADLGGDVIARIGDYSTAGRLARCYVRIPLGTSATA